MAKNHKLFYSTGREYKVVRKEKSSTLARLKFAQMYDGVYQIFSKLEIGRSPILMFYLIERFESGVFLCNDALVDAFNESQQELENPPVSRRQFYRLVADLREVKVIVTEARGFHRINPHLFWAGTSAKRKALLVEIAKAGQEDTYQLFHEPKEESIKPVVNVMAKTVSKRKMVRQREYFERPISEEEMEDYLGRLPD